MLRAFLSESLRIPGMSVVTTWDQRLPHELGITSPSLEVIRVAGPDEEREVFAHLCEEADAVYVIAPELDDELSLRVALAGGSTNAIRSLNCSVEAIDLCGDKWALYQHFTLRGIPTIPTVRVGTTDDHSSLSWPRVLKLRMGAGSQAMQLVE